MKQIILQSWCLKNVESGSFLSELKIFKVDKTENDNNYCRKVEKCFFQFRVIAGSEKIVQQKRSIQDRNGHPVEANAPDKVNKLGVGEIRSVEQVKSNSAQAEKPESYPKLC